MKTVSSICLGVAVALSDLAAQSPETYSSLDKPMAKNAKAIAPGLINFEGADLLQVLKVYGELSGRIVVRPTALPAAKINLQTGGVPLTLIKALQALDTVLSQNGVVMIPQGDEFVKAVPAGIAPQEAVPFCDLPRDQLPDSGTYICYVVEVKDRLPRDLAPLLQPFAKMPNSIVASDAEGLLILRDYASNVRRMLELIERVERAKPAREAAASQ
ncbi:MAG: hypothetical protein L0Y58_06190 [Verrucomicrobia subdivision 3 bacterium]|nr:hypothetical protein [Limisphaerales bacterium]